MHKKRLATELRPGPQGELTALPRPLAGFKGPLRGRENRDEMAGKGQKGEKGGFIPLPPTPGSATT